MNTRFEYEWNITAGRFEYVYHFILNGEQVMYYVYTEEDDGLTHDQVEAILKERVENEARRDQRTC